MCAVVFIIQEDVVDHFNTILDTLNTHITEQSEAIVCCCEAHRTSAVQKSTIRCDKGCQVLVLFSKLDLPITTESIHGGEVASLWVYATNGG